MRILNKLEVGVKRDLENGRPIILSRAEATELSKLIKSVALLENLIFYGLSDEQVKVIRKIKKCILKLEGL
jgi:hypothetical protein